MDTKEEYKKQSTERDDTKECCKCGVEQDKDDMYNQYPCGEYITHQSDWYCDDCVQVYLFNHFQKCPDCDD